MVASVAVLSDIHGVLPALDAVLAEPDVAAADRIVLTGDIAAGPQPVQVLDRLLGLGDRVTWVRGNADRWPNGPTTSCTPGPATPMRSPPSPPATAAPDDHSRPLAPYEPASSGGQAGHDADAVTRARLRRNRPRSSGGSTPASRSSESETSRWNAVAASRPSGVSATEIA